MVSSAVSDTHFPPNSVIYFGSNAGIGAFSNFAKCPEPFEWNGHVWDTAEHAYQAIMKLKHREDWKRFARGGDLSTLEKGIPLVFPKDVDKKMRVYRAKQTGRPEMLGIVAKMAVKPQHARRLGIELNIVDETTIDVVVLGSVFSSILVAKYIANPPFCKLLLDTQDKYLVEFDRGAECEAKAGRPPLWAGLISKNDNKLYGKNLQGLIHMFVRDQIISSAQEARA